MHFSTKKKALDLLEVVETFTRLSDYVVWTIPRFNFAERTKRDCKPCGTGIIPYPLSTGPNCGDPKYDKFFCNTTTGQIYWVAPNNESYRVTNINGEQHKFSIEINGHQTCESIDVMLKDSPALYVDSSCNSGESNPIAGPVFTDATFQELEIHWKQPLEPLCNKSINCIDWPNSSCSATGHGESRCLCNASFRWDPVNFTCIPGEEII